MNIFLWVLQILLALHTIMGAVWKFSHSAEKTMPSLKAIPHKVWIGLSLFELLCSLGLVLPALNPLWDHLALLAAIGIAAEMLIFCGIHLRSGAVNRGPMVYWLVVAALCAVIVYGRFELMPL